MTGGAGGAPPRRELVAPNDAPRLDVLVAAELGLSRNQAATLIANGNVTVDGRTEKASYRARAGEPIAVHIPAPPARAVLAESIPLDVRYEDDDVLVVDKPAGMVVHPAPGNWSGTLVNALKGRGAPLAEGSTEGREGIVHRLDKETSGLLLVAKTDRAHRVLGAELQARRIVRRYAVLAWGHLGEDRLTVDKPIARDPRDRKRMAIVSKGRPARTDFTRLARFDSADLLRAHLYTGRTHQIRVHLAAKGWPIVGDAVYGTARRGTRDELRLSPQLTIGRQALHAWRVGFPHPSSGAALEVSAEIPADMQALLDAAERS